MLLKHSLTKTRSASSQGRWGGQRSTWRLPHEPPALCFPLSDKMTTPDSITKGNIAFALSVFKKLADANQAADVFFSPFSISAALAMVMLGARGNTATQMSEVQQAAHGGVKRATFSSAYNRKKLRRGGWGEKKASNLKQEDLSHRVFWNLATFLWQRWKQKVSFVVFVQPSVQALPGRSLEVMAG